MPTITDIARASGTSKTTVSKVLNGGDNMVSRETKARVVETMRRLGYRPSAMARGLSRKRSDMIGVVAGMGPGILSATYFTSIIGGVLDESARHDRAMSLYNRIVWRDQEHSETIFSDGRCDGLIVLTPSSIDGLASALLRLRLPFVAVNPGEWIPGAFCIDIDNARVGRELTEYLIATGHRRIAYVHAHGMKAHTAQRFEGYRQALDAANFPLDEALVVVEGDPKFSGFERTLPLLSLPESRRPTAIICADDSTALNVIIGLRDANVRVPADVSVAGINGIPDSANSFPPLTTVSQSLEELGIEATKLLLEIIDNPSMEPRHIVWPTELIVRGSVAPPNAGGLQPERKILK